ncbi:MAG: amino acid dehydrogenase, partial [Marinoscillum sp.]
IFYGPIAEYVDQHAALITDFISNCGMARTFAFLMDPKNDEKITDDEIFRDISHTIEKALVKVYDENPEKTGLAEAAFKIALNQLI